MSVSRLVSETGPRASAGQWLAGVGRLRRTSPACGSGLSHTTPPPRARTTWRHGCGQTGRVLAAFWGEYRCWTFTGIEDWRFRCHHAAVRRSCFPFPHERLRPSFGPNPLSAPQCDGCSLSIAVIGSSHHSVDFSKTPDSPGSSLYDRSIDHERSQTYAVIVQRWARLSSSIPMISHGVGG